MEGGSDFMYEFKHNPKRASCTVLNHMHDTPLPDLRDYIYIYICCITMDLQPQILIQKLTDIYMVECTIPWACEFVELSSWREDYERNLRIAENGELKSLLQKTAAPLREGDLTAGGVLYPLHLGFASHHLFCLVKKGRKTKLKIPPPLKKSWNNACTEPKAHCVKKMKIQTYPNWQNEPRTFLWGFWVLLHESLEGLLTERSSSNSNGFSTNLYT